MTVEIAAKPAPNPLALSALVLVVLAAPFARSQLFGLAVILAVPGLLLALASLFNGRAKPYALFAVVIGAVVLTLVYFWAYAPLKVDMSTFVPATAP